MAMRKRAVGLYIACALLAVASAAPVEPAAVTIPDSIKTANGETLQRPPPAKAKGLLAKANALFEVRAQRERGIRSHADMPRMDVRAAVFQEARIQGVRVGR